MTDTVIFIDSGYLIAKCLEKNRKLNFVKLSQKLVRDNWKKTIFYDALPKMDTPRYSKTQKFHSSLRKIDKFDVRLGRLQYNKNGKPTQKGVDMKLGIDLVQMSMKKEFENAILITGDSDFLYAVQKAQESNVRVTLAYIPGSKINKAFQESFDGIELLHDELLDKCEREW